MNSPDLGQQGAIGRFARAFGPAAPSIIARRRDAHHIAHDANRKRLALVLDETEFHFGASEKMRKVFFKISRSMRRRSFSRCKRHSRRPNPRQQRIVAFDWGRRGDPAWPLPVVLRHAQQPCSWNPQLRGNLAERPTAACQ